MEVLVEVVVKSDLYSGRVWVQRMVVRSIEASVGVTCKKK